MTEYKEFVDFCKRQKVEFNPPINVSEYDCASKELRDLLSIANGEANNSDFLFRYKHSEVFLYYKFLNWNEIQKVTNDINQNPSISKHFSKYLYHFAIRKNKDKKFELLNSFAIDVNNVIYKCNFKEDDNFNLVKGLDQLKLYENLKDFLSNQRRLITLDFQINYKFK